MSRRGNQRIVVGLAVVLIALLGVAVERGLAWQHTRSTADARSAAVDAASRQVTALVGIGRKTSREEMDRILAGATGDFRAELQGQVDELRKQAKANKVRSTGEVDSAGLERINDAGDRAVVVVAASGTVTNRSTKGPEARRYRFRVQMQEQDGDWLVAGLEFVS